MNQTTDKILLDKNENPLGCSPLVLKGLSEQLQPNRYPAFNPLDLREKISRYNQLTPEQVILGNGSDELLFLIARHYLGPNDEVIIPNSSFEGFDYAAAQNQAKAVKTELTDYGIDLDKITQAISDNTKLIFLANPNNPTGSFITIEQIEGWLTSIPSDVIVVIDEAYIEYAMADCSEHASRILKQYQNVAFTRTFSKIHGLSALRVGYCLANETIIKNMSRFKAPFNVNGAAVIAANIAFDDADHVKASYTQAAEQKAILCECIEKLNGRYVKSGGNFVLMTFDTQVKSLHQFLMDNGVYTKYFVDEYNEEFLRITLGKAEDNRLLCELLEQYLSQD